ncbi:MAG: glycosyltransferase family 4 protein [Nitrososphaerales archaeon]|jgi:glycosyltransferase involved in cell wall biosynthesis|nr:glycosyltransferase family 4 protein [Nitrososphaerales archaeon]|tara:strand:- start:1534 stop:2733 length:1200 start_codon:yes stop_codon:yes gene_type:complete
MKIVFFSFYYPPDLSAGSFRSAALSKALEKKIGTNDVLHVITTHPNRYPTHRAKADNTEVGGKITIHRISVPTHRSGMISQAYTFSVFAFFAFNVCRKLKPGFIIGTTSRLMTGVLTWISAKFLRQKYYIDLRDIFSETISDLFALKNGLLSATSKRLFSFLDKQVLNSAAGVNVVSEGFPEYFEKKGINTSNWSFFPNGVDEEFLSFTPLGKEPSKNFITILYAGNIGNGQGLETVIPDIAKRLGLSYRFVIIGDGGAISLLRTAIQQKSISNVELLSPVNRSELIKYYMGADIMFLHLNNIPAFRRVLPSKIFEYTALRKPIVAGLNGYSAQFLKDNVPYAFLFEPGDSKAAASCVFEAVDSQVPEEVVTKFVTKYSRLSIMDQMANQLNSIMDSSR